MAFSKTFPKQIWKVKADISQPIVADRWARRKFRYVKRKFEFDYVGLGAHRAMLPGQERTDLSFNKDYNECLN